jgi:hypothetical protein
MKPKESKAESKLTATYIFGVMVTEAIMDTFGTSVKSLRFVQSVLLKNGENYLMHALELMDLGFSVWLFTDLKETFVIESDAEIGSLLKMGLVRSDGPAGYIFLCLNPVVNRLLAFLEEQEIKMDCRYYNAISSARKTGEVQNSAEMEILTAVRQPDYHSLTLTKKDDQKMVLHCEQALHASDATDLNAILAEHDFQTVTVTRTAGKNARITRSLPLRLNSKNK